MAEIVRPAPASRQEWTSSAWLQSPVFERLRINETSFNYYRRLERVSRFVEENYSERIILQDVARVAGMERSAFSTFFHCKTGICFRDWLAAFRVAKAMDLLAENNHSIRETASLVGYRNLRSFQRVFLRFAGCSPIEFKHSVRPS